MNRLLIATLSTSLIFAADSASLASGEWYQAYCSEHPDWYPSAKQSESEAWDTSEDHIHSDDPHDIGVRQGD